MYRIGKLILISDYLLQKHLRLYLFYLIMLFSIADGAETIATDNPFQAGENHLQSSEPSLQVDPLAAYPATQYIVHGVIVMADNAVAVVYTPRNTWHRLRVHSQMGQEQAVIRQITTQGIQIDKEGTLLWLPVLQ